MTEKTEEFQVEHLGTYTEAGLPWPPELPPAFILKTGRRCQRQREMLWLEEQTRGYASTLACWTARDLNMTMGWSKVHTVVAPCLVPTSSVWV